MARAAGELTNQAGARARFIRISAYKVREVCALIKGKQIDEARRVLAFTTKAASKEISKVLESAIANAEHNFQIPQDELFVKNAWADEGLTIKRGRARAQGRYFRIRKRTAHINLLLERLPEERQARPRPTSRRAKAVTSAAEPKTTKAPKDEEKKRPRRRSAPKAVEETSAEDNKEKEGD